MSRHQTFHDLHQHGCFVMPNPWDAGSARVMAGLGARALATSSAAHAFTLGRLDGGTLSRDEALAHAEMLVAATDLPVNGDLENGFSDDPDTVAETVLMAAEVGLVIAEADRAAPVVLHGPTAAAVLRERFAIHDEEVLTAVRDHTLGNTHMPMIAKIILLADKFEPSKRSKRPVMREIRRLARRDIDMALLCWSDWSLLDHAEHGWMTHPRHWAARREWRSEHINEAGGLGPGGPSEATEA